jgi:transposase
LNKTNNDESIDESSSSESLEQMLHPNQEAGSDKESKSATQRYSKKKHYKGCAKYLHRFDEMIMKPVFIYRYERKMQKKSKEFFRVMMKQGEEIENEFTHMGREEMEMHAQMD